MNSTEQIRPKKKQTIVRGPSKITEEYLMYAFLKHSKIEDKSECVYCALDVHTIEEHNKIIYNENSRIYQYIHRHNKCAYRKKELQPKTTEQLFGPLDNEID